MPVKTLTITEDENELRLDRWFRRHFPSLTHGKLEKLLRTGQVRVDGKRAKANTRLEPGQVLRIPPLPEDAAEKRSGKTVLPTQKDRQRIKDAVLFEDKDVLVINKPAGLAVQGGTGISRHLDGFLTAIYGEAERPKLVHRLDKETSGVFVLAKNAFAASRLAESFRSRNARKYYWALTYGVPKPKQGKISLALTKASDGKVHRDEEEGKRAVTLYQVVQGAARIAFVALWPLTGRTHQLRVHMQQIGTPIIGDPLYAEGKNLEVPDGLSFDKLHLHARRLVLPHPRQGTIDVTAPLQDHMKQSWRYFEFPEDDEDPFASYGAGEY
jgi:23S rRNA pseudouridine955/2504/2580 synthase